MSEENKTYKVVRYYRKPNKNHGTVMREGLTLEEAQEHCSQEDTHHPGEWFDGYTEEK